MIKHIHKAYSEVHIIAIAIFVLLLLACASNDIKHTVTERNNFNEYKGKKIKLIQPANINGFGYGCDIIIYFTDGSKLILGCYKYKMNIYK